MNREDYQSKTEKLLTKLPHKLRVLYILNCSNDIKHLIKDLRSLKALEVTELWLQDKVATDKMIIAMNDSIAASYIDYNVVDKTFNDAEYCESYAVDAANDIICEAFESTQGDDAFSAIYCMSQALGVDIKIYYDKLVEFISKLSETEKMVYNINESNL